MSKPPETGLLGPVIRGAVAPPPSRSPLQRLLVVLVGGLLGGLGGLLGYLLWGRPDGWRRLTARGPQPTSCHCGGPDLILLPRHGVPMGAGRDCVDSPFPAAGLAEAGRRVG
jgi:hypothetical protein